MQFKIFKNKNLIQGISENFYGSMMNDKRAVEFLKFLNYKNTSFKKFTPHRIYSGVGLVWAQQVFGSKVHLCKKADFEKIIRNVDGLLSNIPGQTLGIITADCLPILLCDPKNQVVGALHGSRASLVSGIIKNAIDKMVFHFGSNPQDILVGIGPHIRKCHYWLKEKAYQKLKNTHFKKYFLKKKGKIYFDLTELAINEFLKMGIRKENIEDCKFCTFCQFQKYFSSRKEEKSPGIYSEKDSRITSFIGIGETKIFKISFKNFQEIIKKAIKSIREGKVIVCPTDTVYGLIADATNKNTVQKLFKIKKRKFQKPIPIFVRDIKMAKKLAKINKKQEKFLKKVWPGKTTTVLKRKKTKLKLYGVEKKTIALRIPKYKLVNELLKKLNLPLSGTSANISGKSPSGKIKEVLKQFRNQKTKPDLVLDKGNLKPSKPSTIIDLSEPKLKILRKGETSKEKILKVFKKCFQ